MRTIRVYDDRVARPGPIAIHPNVPDSWSTKDILERFGIGEHLRVLLDQDMTVRTLQQGKVG